MAITTVSDQNNRPKHTQWGAFGDVVFQTHNAPGQLSDTRRWTWQAQKVINGYPAHQAGGEDERSISLDITLHNRFTNITDGYQTLLSMAQNQVPRALVIGSDTRGRFALKEIRETLTDTTPEGVIVSVRYSLQLVEVRGEKHA
ncbi:phage tail protein [Lelliottia sp. SL45]|uniref:phage tail protein n=1 Tax=Lelliottia sp. SL45 TaxID=2994665 RepID=UPI0022729FD8|nr:phage tail protein [Lelliottia sp. SL45]MCY1697158.1 phage tail protein [Lelliottia sp. SL45]